MVVVVMVVVVVVQHWRRSVRTMMMCDGGQREQRVGVPHELHKNREQERRHDLATHRPRSSGWRAPTTLSGAPSASRIRK